MAIQPIPGWAIYPAPWATGGSIFASTSNLLIDDTAEKAAIIFRAPKTGTLDKFEFRTLLGTVDAASKLKISFQDVDASGFPDGVAETTQYRLIESGIAANTWMVPGLMTSDGTDIGTKRSVTRGDMLAVVYEYDTFTAADSVSIAEGGSNAAILTGAFPYTALNTGAWAKLNNTRYQIGVLKYSDGLYVPIPGIIPIKTVTQSAFNTGTASSDEQGNFFSLPAPMRVSYVLVNLGAAATADCQLVVYDAASNVLATGTMDGDHRASTGVNVVPFLLDADVDFAANTDYRVVIKPTTTANVTLPNIQVDAAAIMDAIPGGADFIYTERADGGAWTNVDTKRALMYLMPSGFDDGVQTGGGIVAGNMRGGFVNG